MFSRDVSSLEVLFCLQHSLTAACFDSVWCEAFAENFAEDRPTLAELSQYRADVPRDVHVRVKKVKDKPQSTMARPGSLELPLLT